MSNVHTDAINSAIYACSMENPSIMFMSWDSVTAQSMQYVRSKFFDETHLQQCFARPLDKVSPAALRKVATAFLVGNLPFNHAEETIFALLEIASVKCFRIESVPKNRCAKIIWIAHEDAERFERYDRGTVLGDMEGLWIAQSDFAWSVLASIEGEKGCSCPRMGVTVARSTRKKARCTSIATAATATKHSDNESDAEDEVPAKLDKSKIMPEVGCHIGGSRFSLLPTAAPADWTRSRS